MARTGLKELDAVLAKKGFADALVSVLATYSANDLRFLQGTPKM